MAGSDPNLEALVPGGLFGSTEALYRALVEQVPAVVFIDSDEQRPDSIYVSPQVKQLFGYPPSAYTADPELWRDNTIRTTGISWPRTGGRLGRPTDRSSANTGSGTARAGGSGCTTGPCRSETSSGGPGFGRACCTTSQRRKRSSGRTARRRRGTALGCRQRMVRTDGRAVQRGIPGVLQGAPYGVAPQPGGAGPGRRRQAELLARRGHRHHRPQGGPELRELEGRYRAVLDRLRPDLGGDRPTRSSA